MLILACCYELSFKEDIYQKLEEKIGFGTVRKLLFEKCLFLKLL